MNASFTRRHIVPPLLAMCTLPVPHAWAQLSPVGYTAAINTPTADTLPWGTVGLGWTNNIPEATQRWPGAGIFGSANLGFGLAPGLEVVGRVAWDGDTECSTFSNGCQSGTRDVSVSGKFKLPVTLPLDAQLAVGFSDYGGAATHFKQAYGVMSVPWKDFTLSVGYSQPGNKTRPPLMEGPFASLTWQVSDAFKLAVEDDSRNRRVGVWYSQDFSDRVQLQAGMSRRLHASDTRQDTQASMMLRYSLTGHESPAVYATAAKRDGAYWSEFLKAVPEAGSMQQRAHNASPSVGPSQLQAAALRQALQYLGFSRVRVGRTAHGHHWVVEAESQRWRQQPLQAVGAALAAWLAESPKNSDTLLLRTTYMGRTVFTATTSAACASAFATNGQTTCATDTPLYWRGGHGKQPWPDTDWLSTSNKSLFTPQVELEVGPVIDYTVATELGLIDYTLGADGAWQVSTAEIPGLFWQGNAVTPLTRSDDFESGRYFGSRDIRQQVRANMLSYVAQPINNFWVQGNLGNVSSKYAGAQANVHWISPGARFEASALLGRYRHVVATQVQFQPELLEARINPVPGRWSVAIQGGRYFMGDKGYKIGSEHRFGGAMVELYYRQSGSAANPTHPERAFAGFQLTVPLGPSWAMAQGPITLRGRDKFSVGLASKVGESDNRITSGYGVVPQMRHGLSDILGHSSVMLSDTALESRGIVQEAMLKAREVLHSAQ